MRPRTRVRFPPPPLLSVSLWRMSLPDERSLDDLLSLPDSKFGSEVRQRALKAYDERDWYGIYGWTKAWITRGGGAWTVDAWLLYAISALLRGQPRGAVRSVDLALANWIEPAEDRSILHWVRAAIVHQHLKDPKTAEADYRASAEQAPEWLRERLQDDLALCLVDMRASRKRKRSVEPAPQFEPRNRSFVSEPQGVRQAGSVPNVWPQLIATLQDDNKATAS